MSKQRLEGDFRDVIKEVPKLWYHKLQVCIQACTNTPADFIVLTPRLRYLVECKENRSNLYSFSRSTQTGDLLKFNNIHSRNRAFYLINFWLGAKKKSEYYLIPINIYVEFEKIIPKKSANRRDFEKRLSYYRVNLADIWQKFH